MKTANLIFPLLASISLAACAASYTKASDTTLSVKKTSIGEVYADANGMTLYTFAKDSMGKSNCNGPCAAMWPPALAKENMNLGGRFSTISRDDGKSQWAVEGMPLYGWVKDAKKSDLTGNGVNNVWFAARADDVPVSVYKQDGKLLVTDESKMSLYTFDKDSWGKSNCNAACAALWPPVMANSNDRASGPFSLIKRDDGSYQWAMNGKPLYRWVKDTKPGDVSGDGVKSVWHLASWSSSSYSAY